MEAVRSSPRARIFGDAFPILHENENVVIQDVLHFAREGDFALDRSVVLIENPSDQWMSDLEAAGLSTSQFWQHHTGELDPDDHSTTLWNDIFGDPDRSSKVIEHERTRQMFFCTIHGVFGYGSEQALIPFTPNSLACRRREETTDAYGLTSATRISYGRIHVPGVGSLYVILVDAARQPLSGMADERPTLRVPHTNSRGGLALPSLYQPQKSLFDSFSSFFSHEWHRRLLFVRDPIIDPKIFTCLLCLSLWATNLRLVTTSIEKLSFSAQGDRRFESMSAKLHKLRQNLSVLRKGVTYDNLHIPLEVWMDTENLAEEHNRLHLANRKKLKDILEDAADQQTLLDDFFQLWMSELQIDQAQKSFDMAAASKAVVEESKNQAITANKQMEATNNLLSAMNSIIDESKDATKASSRLLEEMVKIAEANQEIARESRRKADESAYQTTRATALTLLAAIYLPLSFATGIFGMNISAVDPANQWSVGNFLATLFTLLALTLGIMGLYLYWEKRSRRKKEEARVTTVQDSGGYELSIPPKMWET